MDQCEYIVLISSVLFNKAIDGPWGCGVHPFMNMTCTFNRGHLSSCKILTELHYRSFSSDVTAAILVYQNNEMAAILVYGTGISSFLFKYFVLFHHPTGATDHVSENDLYYMF